MSENTVLENKATADRDPSTLHENMRDWIEETTGYAADLKTVQLTASLRIKFQKSEKNQEDLEARKQAALDKIAAREAGAEERIAKAEARAKAKEEADAAKLAKKEAAAVAKAEAAQKKKDDAEAAEAAAAGMDVDPNDPEAPQLPLPAKTTRRRTTAAKSTAKPVAKKPVAKKAAAPKATAAAAE